jgi:hypothetical protein
MSSLLRSWIVSLVSLVMGLAASGGAAATAGGVPGDPVYPRWKMHMSAGQGCFEVGDADGAASHYRQALRIARSQSLNDTELAFSAYRLGETIRLHPGAARGESALTLLDESLRHFEAAYGDGHPVLIPIWIRIAHLQTAMGDEAAADRSRTAADRIAARFFPESHFLRERYGTARPGLMLHPLDVLRLIGSPPGPTGRVVTPS